MRSSSGVAPALFRAWCEAKNLALEDDEDATFSNFAWVRQAWEEQRAVMGSNPWRFGIKGNEKTLEAQIRYAGEQGLLARKIGIEDLYIRMDEV
jgi:4,5-dihydroxyphthalate decarboxylase